MNRVSAYKLAKALLNSQRLIKPGIWVHIKSGAKYRVVKRRVLDEQTLLPLVVYYRIGWPYISRVIPEYDFLQNFKKHN